ncbi:unnamed protein product [Rotaria sordida]|uniref:Fungal lipase-like domain-containing protein n=1 Tax=Rotaria sordida TaxID=392033 RepID=A0A814K075_9BILA|nr:unnamed protein product [Rotaria sordida]
MNLPKFIFDDVHLVLNLLNAYIAYYGAERHQYVIAIRGVHSSNDLIPIVISFTGHSLGAALAESLACIYHTHAVTFDSPGTKHILSNDPSCQTNIDLGYNPKTSIHTYLGPHANLIHVARP